MNEEKKPLIFSNRNHTCADMMKRIDNAFKYFLSRIQRNRAIVCTSEV